MSCAWASCIRGFSALAIASALIGCATIAGTIPASKPLRPGSLPGTDAFLAGAAKVDITPPPGFPLGGHGFAGQVSRGHWLRLYARAIYLEDSIGQAIVLVSADLWSIPGGLPDRVAELVGRRDLECNVRRDGLIIAATHTHQSPGNFSSSSAYNTLASPDFGFDRQLFEFLARRVTDSIASACNGREAARLRRASTSVPLLFRNRSMEAFKLNPEHRSILEENAGLPAGHSLPEYPDPTTYRAIDSAVRVWQVSSVRDDRTIAVAAFAAVHPTTIDHSTNVYSSDLFGVAATLVEQRLSAGPAEPPGTAAPGAVVAIFNGAEGDVSANWAYQNRRDTVALGRRLADAIRQSLTDGTSVDGRINFRVRTARVANACYVRPDRQEACTASTALIGAATLGGAEDGRTNLYDPWKEGAKREGVVLPNGGDPRQAPKWPALDHPSVLPAPISPTHWLGTVLSVPEDVYLGVYRVGEVALVPLPGEFTTVMGRRVAQTVRRTIRPEVKDVIVIGLANEYVSYFATPEEYQAQHYEGASTLYGGESGPVILEEIRKLSIELDNHPPAASPARDFSYAAGVSRSFVLSVNDGTAAFPRAIAVDLTNGGQIAGALLPTHCWREPYSDLRTSPADRTIPTVWIEHQAVAGTWQAFAPNGAREDDHGLNFVAIARRVAVNTIEWCSGWLGAPREETSQQFRFCVQTARGVAGGCSNTFTVPRR